MGAFIMCAITSASHLHKVNYLTLQKYQVEKTSIMQRVFINITIPFFNPPIPVLQECNSSICGIIYYTKREFSGVSLVIIITNMIFYLLLY